ncbi:TetR/AcrR family transcriptional regulator [Agrococcus casei]|uniref:TetR/AcrR family transcriptional regulator n=1 Tax=Agrococcus casei TaxID=343512 RepID=UPI003F8FA592
MPRTADHAARRAQICSGVRRAALDGGLAGVSLSNAARAAGVSVGLVQHYYGSKEELLVDTLERVLADALARVDRATTDAEQRHSRIEHMLANGLEQLLPLDEVRREETVLRLSFASLALDRPELRSAQRRFSDLLRARASAAVRNAYVCGEVPDSALTDPDLEGLALLALVDGLAGELLLAPESSDEARRVIAQRMHELCPGLCSHHDSVRIP